MSLFTIKGRVIIYLIVIFTAVQIGGVVSGINKSLKELNKRVEISVIMKGLRQ